MKLEINNETFGKTMNTYRLKNALPKNELINTGTCVAQSVKHLTSAEVMISWFMSSRPMSGSVLTAQNLEPASGSVSSSL